MSAITDTNKIKKDDKANPDICMVGYYHNLFSQSEKDCIFDECRAGKRGCVACKRQLARNISEYLRPIREKRQYFENNKDEVRKILKDGTKKARIRASETMYKVKEKMKINYFD